MELIKEELPSRIFYKGGSNFTISPEGYLQLRYGDPNNPNIELQEQVPVGKSWEVHVTVSIKEVQ